MDKDLAIPLKAALKEKGVLEIKLRGHCMEPLLYEGDRAHIVPADNFQIGNLVLVLLSNNLFALHRVVGVCKKGIIAKGDYSGTSEEVSLSKVVGTALDFSLAGGAWVKDPRSNVELAHLASLSASLVHNPANRNVRELIWKANEATRQLMLSCASL